MSPSFVSYRILKKKKYRLKHGKKRPYTTPTVKKKCGRTNYIGAVIHVLLIYLLSY